MLYIAIYSHLMPNTKLPNMDVDCGWSRWVADVSERRDGINFLPSEIAGYCQTKVLKNTPLKSVKKMHREEE